MSNRWLRIGALVAAPLIALAGGLALGYSAGQAVPSKVALFGQLADHVVLTERVRAGDIETFEHLALPTIALSVIALHHGGYFGHDAEPRVVEIAGRALDLLRNSGDAFLSDELRTEAIAILEPFAANPKEKGDGGS